MDILSVLIFLLYTYGLGYSCTRHWKHGLSENILRLAVGLACILLLGVIFNLIGIPIQWYFFLFLGLAGPLYDIIGRRFLTHPQTSIPWKKYLSLGAILLFLSCVYLAGPFTYPWLENDDPWGHAAVTKYIATEKTLTTPSNVFQYLNPYPPGYNLIFALVHQTAPSLSWVLKFFNGLIIILGYLFFYVFVKEWTQNEKKGMWALFSLACIPCYLSHFIWAHALAVSLFFPALLFSIRALKDRKYIPLSIILINAIILTQVTQAFKFLILLAILFLAASILYRKIQWAIVLITVGALSLSLLWWVPVIVEQRSGNLKIVLRTETRDLGDSGGVGWVLKRFFDPASGSATRAYSLSEHLYPPKANMINNPLGIGPVLSLCALFGLFFIFRKMPKADVEEKLFIWTLFGWLIFTFLGLNTATFNLPVGLFAFRFWMLLAFVLAILAAEFFTRLFHEHEKTLLNIIVSFVCVLGVLATSAQPKLNVNSAMWPYGVHWSSQAEVRGYIWIKENLPLNTPVFTFTENQFVIGVNMVADYWSDRYKKMAKNTIDISNGELYDRLKRNGYHFLIIDQRTAKTFGNKKAEGRLEELFKNPYFQLTHHEKGAFWLFRLKDPQEIKPITYVDQYRL